MPLRLPEGSTIMVVGSGPIVIGQACEFDFSGTQACKALQALGYRVVLLNSNPATIMTDERFADATYIEPLTLEFATRVIEREKPDALLPTVGGQVGLNLSLELHQAGVLEKHGVKLIGADPEAIELAEDRQLFKAAMVEIGVGVARSGIATTLEEAEAVVAEVGLPAIIRPSFTLGGAGGGTAWNMEEFRIIAADGLNQSPTNQILVEQSLLGWKEFELEVIRDLADNVVIICSIENFDPMGVHTGDSITVAPSQTLTDVEYQHLRDLSQKIIRRVGVETGGSNIQFSVSPFNGEVVVIEMNPRVSRSSALASKATGFPIAKIAAQLAVGLTLDEIDNDITKKTPACFEPTLDYVIVKIPRWNFEKFSGVDNTLGTAMRAVGEVMGVGQDFQEALLKAIYSLEGGWPDLSETSDSRLQSLVAIPTPDRLAAIFESLRRGRTVEDLHEDSKIDPWFLDQIAAIIDLERQVVAAGPERLTDDLLRRAKEAGLGDADLARALGTDEAWVAERAQGLTRVYKRIDTCAAEFESYTPYLYSTYGDEDEAGESEAPRVVILGNGPNRIGQGLEFDYCCCHAAFSVAEAGYTSVMLNCNPETVSTDYDTSDKLYFEPCTKEHVQAVLDREKPKGVVLQFGGQTPLKLAHRIGPVLGTDPDAIDLCEDRERFHQLMKDLDVRQPEGAMASTRDQAVVAAERIGFPLLVRPSYVLGGRAMQICWDETDFEQAVDEALRSAEGHPVLLDRYLEAAVEYDVDALCDGREVVIGAILEHIEEAGVHSGDSATVIPPVELTSALEAQMIEQTTRIAKALGVVGLVNIQWAVQDGELFVIEVNPRASRTVPFVSKATGVPLASIATRLCLGERLADQEIKRRGEGMFFIKAPVFPWRKFMGSDVALGPEMRSTGEVMGVGRSFGEAYAKALIGAGNKLPTEGGVFLSLRDFDKEALLPAARSLVELGYKLIATRGTTAFLRQHGVACEPVFKVKEGRPDVVDAIKNGQIQLILNTPMGKRAQHDERAIRVAALQYSVPCITTRAGIKAVVQALIRLRTGPLSAVKLQEIAWNQPRPE